MVNVRGCVKLSVVYLVGFMWGGIVFLQVLRLAITKRGKFFYKKDRKDPPACLNDPDLGTHRYVQLPKQVGRPIGYTPRAIPYTSSVPTAACQHGCLNCRPIAQTTS